MHDLHGPVVGVRSLLPSCDPNFQPFLQKVATILLERGQLTYVQLARLLRVPSPSFSHAQLRAALLVLIQHNMLFHSLGTQQDLFQISTVEIIARAWFGDFVGLAEEVAGPAGRIVTHCALLEGKVKVAELVQMAQTQAAEEDASGQYPST